MLFMPENLTKTELPKAYEPSAIEMRWAEFWVKEKLFSVPTPPEGDTRPAFRSAAATTQRYRAATHGAHVRADADGHYCAMASHARLCNALAAGHPIMPALPRS